MRILLGVTVAGLLIGLAGCGSSDTVEADSTMPPAKTKEEGESRASQSGGGQFNRSSDRN